MKKYNRSIVFIIYFSTFFVLPIFIAVPRLNVSDKFAGSMYVIFLFFTILHIRNEWRLFPNKKYLRVFVPFILNFLVITFLRSWYLFLDNIVIGWAMTFSSIIFAQVAINLYKDTSMLIIKKRNWEEIKTPFLKQYWKKNFFKQISYVGESLTMLIISMGLNILVYIFIIYPDYISYYNYPVNIFIGLYVLISIVFGAINYGRIFNTETLINNKTFTA